ncbi:MAG: ABC-2 family transporter protein [Candidatus Hydrothermae bacterium]|nr:ABC-2 family transporter protein [Candidatus Hydrothermae bacterium]
MNRYARLLTLFWTTSVAQEMEYRLNFLLALLSSLGSAAGGLFGLSLFYRTGHALSGWTFPEAVAVLGVFTLLQAFSRALLFPNLNRIVDHVQYGTLDFILLKPVDSQFWISLRILSPWGLPDALMGCALLIWAMHQVGVSLRALAVVLPALLAALLILYGLWFFLASLTIWFVKIYNVTYVLQSFLEAGRFPVGAYPALFRLFFTFVIPVAFLTTIPARTAVGRATGDPATLGLAWLLGGILFVLSRLFWRFALRFYTSASS